MLIIKPSAEYLRQDGSPYLFIEKVARTCYKSEDNITEGSAEKMIRALAKSKHYAMLEHYTLYLDMTDSFIKELLKDLDECSVESRESVLKYFNVTHTGEINIISGSFRSFLELFAKIEYMDDRVVSPYSPLPIIVGCLKTAYPLIFEGVKEYMTSCCDSGDCKLLSREDFVDKYKDYPNIISTHLTHSVKFICDRGVTHEFVRHRVCAFAQESTRYCNYSKDKFGNEITVIEPCYFDKMENDYTQTVSYLYWEDVCEYAEKKYFELLKLGRTPQEARAVLPNSLKTEIVITATEKEWQHIINLRYKGTTGSPHPQMKEVMELAYPMLIKESKGRLE